MAQGKYNKRKTYKMGVGDVEEELCSLWTPARKNFQRGLYFTLMLKGKEEFPRHRGLLRMGGCRVL